MKSSLKPGLTHRFTYKVPDNKTVPNLYPEVADFQAMPRVFATGYMQGEAGFYRFFAYMGLFMFSMLGIVLANNFIMMFIFWELVGFSSYLLIGHWFYRPAPPVAANKAFLANRIGDFGFMLGILLVWSASGTVTFDELPAGTVPTR